MDCRIQEIPEISGNSHWDIGRAIGKLAEQKIDPESFHQENLDRFELVGECPAQKIESYAFLQKELADKIAKLPTNKIKEAIKGLIASSYYIDRQTSEMKLETSESGRRNKRELDLWIAAINHRAYEDEKFLKKIFGDGEIRALITLNSPHMSAADRGSLWRVIVGPKMEPSESQKYRREINAQMYQRLFSWLKGYDGKGFYIEDPFWRSSIEMAAAAISYFGKESYYKMNAGSYPHETVKDLLTKNNLLPRYLGLKQKDTQSLIDYSHELMLGLHPTTRPGIAKFMVEEIVMISATFHERGVDLYDSLEQKAIQEMINFGWSEEDAERFVKLQQGAAKYTADRLDDYRGRFAFLRQYRKLYDNILSQPLDETFSPEQRARYSIWGNFILNRSQSGIPVQLAELDQIRWEVQKKRFGDMEFSQGRLNFEWRELDKPHWFMPSDLGLCGLNLGGPMVLLSNLSANGTSVNDLVCNNIELLPFLPSHLLPNHEAAAAFGAFGIATVRNEGFSDKHEWTPGLLLEALTHEASHIEWFRENFDRHSERLLMLGPNERRAYAVGNSYLTEYVTDYVASPSLEERSAGIANDRLIQGRQVVAAANERLGLSSDQMNPFYWNDSWDTEPVGKLAFQPAHILQERQRQLELTKAFGPLTPRQVRRMRIPLFHKAIDMVTKDNSENWDARDALLHLISGRNKDRGIILSGGDIGIDIFGNFYQITPYRSRLGDLQPKELILKSHPMTRAYNLLRAELGEPPVFNIDLDQESWLKEMDRITVAIIENGRMLELMRRKDGVREALTR